MGKYDATKRLAFLAERFDVFECDKDGGYTEKEKELVDSGHDLVDSIKSTYSDKVLALLSRKYREGKPPKLTVSIEMDVFTDMIAADPSEKKEYLQWMLSIVNRNLKEGKIVEAVGFMTEDLLQAKEYLILFQENKRKKKFLELVSITHTLKGVKDRSDINQYKSLSQLFDSVDPFIERNVSGVERAMRKYVDLGKAEIPFKDRNYTVFVPRVREANVIFDNFASWCTAKEGNGMFENYTKNNRNSFGGESTIYIIIDNGFFTGESDKLYQIHFETNQVRNRNQSGSVDFYEEVLTNSEGISNYFEAELTELARASSNVKNNNYTKYLIKFGFSDVLFSLYDENILTIMFNNERINKMGDLSRFKELREIIIMNSGMRNLHDSIGQMDKLEMLAIPSNGVTELPYCIGDCRGLIHLNLIGNPIKDFPNTMGGLDKSNGGSLYSLAIREKDVGKVNIDKLRKLLPQTKIINQ